MERLSHNKNKHVFFNEQEDQWLFEVDKDLPLKNQVIFEDQKHYLLNVLKIYTNEMYYGMQCSCLVKKDKSIYHLFRCKDRGFTEEVVDDKSKFLSLYKQDLLHISPNMSNDTVTWTSEKANFLDEYQVHFVYNMDGDYEHTTAVVNGATVRGVYGAVNQENFEKKSKQLLGYMVISREPTEEEVKTYLIDKQKYALSNHETRVNTAYSSIKVYHKTEI